MKPKWSLIDWLIIILAAGAFFTILYFTAVYKESAWYWLPLVMAAIYIIMLLVARLVKNHKMLAVLAALVLNGICFVIAAIIVYYMFIAPEVSVTEDLALRADMWQNTVQIMIASVTLYLIPVVMAFSTLHLFLTYKKFGKEKLMNLKSSVIAGLGVGAPFIIFVFMIIFYFKYSFLTGTYYYFSAGSIITSSKYNILIVMVPMFLVALFAPKYKILASALSGIGFVALISAMFYYSSGRLYEDELNYIFNASVCIIAGVILISLFVILNKVIKRDSHEEITKGE